MDRCLALSYVCTACGFAPRFQRKSRICWGALPTLRVQQHLCGLVSVRSAVTGCLKLLVLGDGGIKALHELLPADVLIAPGLQLRQSLDRSFKT